LYVLLALCFGLAAFLWMRARLSGQKRLLSHDINKQAVDLVKSARDDAAAQLKAAEAEAAEVKKRRRDQLAAEIATRRDLLHKATERSERRQQATQRSEEWLKNRNEALTARERALHSLRERQAAAEAGRKSLLSQAEQTLLTRADETRDKARERLVTEAVEQVRAEVKDQLRQLEQNASDPEQARLGKRTLEIAIQRYQGHYLTERLLSNLPVPPGAVVRAFGLTGLEVIGEVANVKLTLSEDEQSVRLEGQDSFGREIARRAISRFLRLPPRGDDAVRRAVTQIAEELERETVELGKRAFKELEIPRAHPDIVRLVGRLNYRTSYTQNQWKHAIESAFLCGMMADEMRLDLKIARRAALMHDIGKALTHEIDGSHAVIGADYARRLGESEVVANAIGAHHTDEPFNSPYAFIVAAADALSGGRPGARHEQADNYVQRIEDLERLAASFHGIERVFAVQAGREVRVHVKQDIISDERAASMSSEIAEKISANMVFPGQIKVTVIREVTASHIAS
jgi:ribonuclease Y